MNGATLIRILVLLLLFGIPLIGRLLAAMRQAQQPPAVKPPPRPVPNDLADEIEKFVRRHTNRPQGAGQQQATPRPVTPKLAPLAEQVARTTPAKMPAGRRAEELSPSQPARATGEPAVAVVAVESAETAEAAMPEIPGPSAVGLAALLANPESVRQAIILNEILHRPEERW